MLTLLIFSALHLLLFIGQFGTIAFFVVMIHRQGRKNREQKAAEDSYLFQLTVRQAVVVLEGQDQVEGAPQGVAIHFKGFVDEQMISLVHAGMLNALSEIEGLSAEEAWKKKDG